MESFGSESESDGETEPLVEEAGEVGGGVEKFGHPEAGNAEDEELSGLGALAGGSEGETGSVCQARLDVALRPIGEVLSVTNDASGIAALAHYLWNGQAITDPTQWMREFQRQQTLHNGTSDAGGNGSGTVTVQFKGLDNIHVTGASGLAGAKIKQGAAMIAAGISETVVPASHRGA